MSSSGPAKGPIDARLRAAGVLTAPLRQVAMVVTDLQTSVRTWAETLGVGPWTGYRLEPPVIRDTVYRGRPAEFGIFHALAVSGGVQLELVQPTFGPSIFADHLDAHGEGLHHVGVYVDDHPGAVARALSAGWVPLQSARGFGARGDGAFAYFEVPGVPTVVELIEAPAERRKPDLVHPPVEVDGGAGEDVAE